MHGYAAAYPSPLPTNPITKGTSQPQLGSASHRLHQLGLGFTPFPKSQGLVWPCLYVLSRYTVAPVPLSESPTGVAISLADSTAEYNSTG